MMKKIYRAMTVFMGTVVIGSSLFTGCSKKENSSTSVEGNNIVVSPTEEVTTEPTKEATVVPTKEATQEPTKEAQVTQGISDPTKSDISVTYESIDDIIKEDENSEVVLIQVTYNHPVVTIPNNEAASKKINDYFAKLNEEFQAKVEEYKADAKGFYEEWNSDFGFEWTGYEIDTNYNLERADENCISFSCNSYYDFLGPHPTSELLGYTFNTSTGDLLTLEDISSDVDAFQSQVNDQVLEYCKLIEKEYGEGMFNEGYEDDIPNILQANTWYFDEKGFEVIANEYTIAPHALGIISVLIPYHEMVGVKEEFIKK